MTNKLPPDASDLFEKGNQYALENGKVLAYGLKGATKTTVQQVCDQATESYAREVLNWPHGRLAKPDIFEVVAHEGNFRDLGDCTKQFVKHLHNLFQSSPPKSLPTYPHAFIAVAEKEAQSSVILILAHKHNDQWKLEHCSVPVHIELGQAVESLRLGDISAEDILDQFKGDDRQQEDGSPKNNKSNTSRSIERWAFALFSTGLQGALPLPAMIDPSTDRVHPSEATVHLVDDPDTSYFQMSEKKMKQLFPITVRDDERRGWRKNGMKLHNKVFICCDNDEPKEKGVLVIQAEWDGKTDRKDAELEEAFGKAKLHETRVSVGEALDKVRELAQS